MTEKFAVALPDPTVDVSPRARRRSMSDRSFRVSHPRQRIAAEYPLSHSGLFHSGAINIRETR